MKRALKFGIYALLYWSGLWLVARKITRSKTRILMYHGVVQQDIDVWTQLPIDRFRAQIQYLARWYRPVRLTEFVDNKKRQNQPLDYSTVVTFDDGLKNNLTQAYPILKDRKVPATIYIAISLIDRPEQFGGMIWTDYVRGLIRTTQGNTLDLTGDGLAQYDLSTPEAKRETESRLARDLKKIDSVAREQLIEKIATQLGPRVARAHAIPFDGLTWDEIRTLDASGIVEFGAHTVNHAILTTVSDQQAEQEMADSQARLEHELKHPIRHFAYPNGTRADFSDRHMTMAARHFDSAVSTVEGLAAPDDGLFDLKRINVGNDMSMMEFKLRLSGALELLGI